LVGYNAGDISTSFWNSETSGQNEGVGGAFGTTTNLTGVTTAQMQTLSTFMNAGWDIQEDASLFVGTPVLSMTGTSPTWLLGTKGASTKGASTKQEEIIASIDNGTAIKPPVQAPQQFSFGGESVQLASIPSADTPNQLIGTQEARAMMQGNQTGDFSVPVEQNSQLHLINGGVHLPKGLEQLFYIAQREGK